MITGEQAAKLVVNFKDVVCVFIIGLLINGEYAVRVVVANM